MGATGAWTARPGKQLRRDPNGRSSQETAPGRRDAVGVASSGRSRGGRHVFFVAFGR